MPFADNAGTKIYWEESGTGEPLLLIMGLGYPHDMWHRTRPVVSSHYRTILFDNRGVGKSDLPPGPYSIAQMAADAAAVLDAAGVEKANVFGVSMGGMIAQEFALNYPQRVNRLVLGDARTAEELDDSGGAEGSGSCWRALAKMTADENAESDGAVHRLTTIHDAARSGGWKI